MVISTFWLIVAFVGAFILFGAIMWSRQQNKTVTPREDRASEAATRDLYQSQDADDKAGRG